MLFRWSANQELLVQLKARKETLYISFILKNEAMKDSRFQIYPFATNTVDQSCKKAFRRKTRHDWLIDWFTDWLKIDRGPPWPTELTQQHRSLSLLRFLRVQVQLTLASSPSIHGKACHQPAHFSWFPAGYSSRFPPTIMCCTFAAQNVNQKSDKRNIADCISAAVVRIFV